ncbi:hypothetical protein GOV11_04325 [Candidatus Woesearchaeota archaeon]|nr:hypothetical protein [Candidatus Woesearchaeota archaeon]
MNLESILMIVSVLLAVSEGLALIPALASNSIFQMVMNVLKGAKNLLVGRSGPISIEKKRKK